MGLQYTEIESNYTRKRPKLLTIEDVKKAKRKHKKNHAVRAEIARFNARKKKDMQKYMKNRDAIMKKFHSLVKAYWSNEIQNHPDKPTLPEKPKYTLPRKTRISYK